MIAIKFGGGGLNSYCTCREIKAGEEITENYGLSYAKDPLEFRRRICRRHYGFECACAACIGDWPDRADVRDRHSCKQVSCLFVLYLRVDY